MNKTFPLIRVMDKWKSIIEMKSPFLLDGMEQPRILAFCIEDIEYIEQVQKEGGVELAGGKELIKAIQVTMDLHSLNK